MVRIYLMGLLYSKYLESYCKKCSPGGSKNGLKFLKDVSFISWKYFFLRMIKVSTQYQWFDTSSNCCQSLCKHCFQVQWSQDGVPNAQAACLGVLRPGSASRGSPAQQFKLPGCPEKNVEVTGVRSKVTGCRPVFWPIRRGKQRAQQEVTGYATTHALAQPRIIKECVQIKNVWCQNDIHP